MRRALIVSNRPEVITTVSETLRYMGWRGDVQVVCSEEEMERSLDGSPADLLIADWRAFGGEEGASALHVSSPTDDGIEGGGRAAGWPTGEVPAVGASRRARERITSLLEHRLRAPLTFVLGYADVLDGQIDGPHRQMAQSILRYATRLREVIEDLTPLLEWVVARSPDAAQPVDLVRVALEVVSSLVIRAVEKGQTFVFVPPPEPVFVTADRWGIGASLALLVGRLVKWTPPGARLCIRVEGDGEEGVITISGEGETPESVEREDVDLGMVRAMVEAMGGYVDVAVTPNDGISLRLAFPAICGVGMMIKGSEEDGGQAHPYRR